MSKPHYIAVMYPGPNPRWCITDQQGHYTFGAGYGKRNAERLAAEYNRRSQS